ncbi:TM0106 family RecB-like putative nuclease [Candidatus Woesearchaeota archaeon]|nr:TM0106 family RecB-like putative nuclease [Candidatus Woesearchaeota archaeon]
MITATHFYNYTRCPRKVYLDFFGDAEKKLPHSEFMLSRFRIGREHEKDVAKNIKYVAPEKTAKDEEKFRQTVKFMEQGASIIFQGVLIDKDFIGRPDILIKVPGQSRLGDYHYEAIDIKVAVHAKKQYIMQIMFYSSMLQKIQEKMPEFTYLILNNKSKKLHTYDYMNQYAEALVEIKNIASGCEAEVHICSECGECPWRDVCLEKAEKEKDISLIYNLGRKSKELLIENNIDNFEKAADMDVDLLKNIKGLGEASLRRWKTQSRALIDKKTIKIGNPNLPKAKTEIYFDIEGEPDIDIEYLFGLWTEGEYIYFLAKSPEEEKKAWKGFIDFFKDKEDFKIYHYAPYEKNALKKLRKKYGCDEETYRKITNNMIDLFSVVKKTAVLPLYSYSIKDIAKHLGFEWSEKDASGGQSTIWFTRWLAEKDPALIDTILQYNKDDVLATEKVKEWLQDLE